ncbi:MAG: hypothetical protein WB507_04480 [Solirubrobacterales bacterium]
MISGSDETGSFGRRLLQLDSHAQRLELERSERRRTPFAVADSALDSLISSALAGQRVATLDSGKVELAVSLDSEQRVALAEHFEVENQERRGSWHVPESEQLSLGLIHTAYWCGQDPRLLINLAEAEHASPDFRGEPQAVAVWVLEPLFEELFLPFKVRATKMLGAKTVEQQEAYWSKVDPLFAALGIDPGALEPFRPGRGWSQHGVEEVVAIRRALIEAWSEVATEAAPRYRVFRIGQLVERYYAKAKRQPPLRRQVLTKDFGRTLTAYFGGDWLAFLAYIGEHPNPGEEIVQTLPETKLIVGGSEKAAALAEEHGVSAKQVVGLLASFWQSEDGSSPLEQRVSVLKRHWRCFDQLHAELTTDDRGLWGLIQEHDFVSPTFANDEEGGSGDYHPRAWEELLPADLNTEIERLWGVGVMPRWPERLVTEPAPHARLADALGAALRFWQGAALTAWFLCVGPYSRTSLEALADYHARDLSVLDKLNSPVDEALFAELKAAAGRDGEPEYGGGPSVTISIGFIEPTTERHVSFETLRDIITTHRRAWTERHLDQYLRAAWESELRDLGEAYYRLAAERGKDPTLKQFAKLAAGVANRWFGGELVAVYGVLGLKAPPAPTRAERLVPVDPDEFATELYQELRGIPNALPPSWKEDPEERQVWNDFQNLAGQCVKYLQLQEAIGAPPTISQFGRQAFKYRSTVLSDDIDQAWSLFGVAIETVRQSRVAA